MAWQIIPSSPRAIWRLPFSAYLAKMPFHAPLPVFWNSGIFQGRQKKPWKKSRRMKTWIWLSAFPTAAQTRMKASQRMKFWQKMSLISIWLSAVIPTRHCRLLSATEIPISFPAESMAKISVPSPCAGRKTDAGKWQIMPLFRFLPLSRGMKPSRQRLIPLWNWWTAPIWRPSAMNGLRCLLRMIFPFPPLPICTVYIQTIIWEIFSRMPFSTRQMP